MATQLRPLQKQFGAQTLYILRSVWLDLLNRKFATFLTILVIGVSLTIPTVSYLLWKNTHHAATEFYPEPELTTYLNKNLSDNEVNSVVEHIRHQLQDSIESIHYISRQQSLEEFQSWSNFGNALDVLDDNPLPAVVILKPKVVLTDADSMFALRDELQRIKGVEEVRLDNGWLEKLTAMTWLIARIAIICTILMIIAVFLVISNTVRFEVANNKAKIEIMQLLGATEHLIMKPFLYTGMIYGALGSLLAVLFSSLLIAHFTGAVKYVADIFTVKFELTGLSNDEMLFLCTSSIFVGWLSAKIVSRYYISRY